MAAPIEVQAAEAESTEETDYGAQALLDELGLEEVQTMVDSLLESESFSVSEAVRQVMNGESIFSLKDAAGLAGKLLVSRFWEERSLFIKLLLFLLFAAVFSNLSMAFTSSQAAESGFYVVYLLVFTLLVQDFSELTGSLSSLLETLVQVLKVLSPAYYLAVAASTGTSTAAVFYQGILLLVWLVQWILLNLVLPAVNLNLLLHLINHLSKEEMLGRMAELLETVVSWILKTMLGVVLGLGVVQSLVTPAIDSLKRSAVGRAASALPGIGNAIGSVTELILGSAVLVRNSLGAVFLVVFVLLGAGPLVHYGFLSLAYRFLAAVSQPVCDPRLVGCLGSMGDACALLLRIFLTTEVMCILTFLILMIQFGGV
jgi:stage III sporulation protein AE